MSNSQGKALKGGSPVRVSIMNILKFDDVVAHSLSKSSHREFSYGADQIVRPEKIHCCDRQTEKCRVGCREPIQPHRMQAPCESAGKHCLVDPFRLLNSPQKKCS